MAVTDAYRASVKNIQRVSAGIFSIGPSSQNRPKVSIAGTVAISSNPVDGTISGDIRVHDGETPGGISIPPPGTVSHILTKQENTGIDNLAGALNKGYLKNYLLSSNFQKMEKDGSALKYSGEWRWIDDSKTEISEIKATTAVDSYSGLYFKVSPVRISNVPANYESYSNNIETESHNLDILYALSKKPSCRWDIELTARTFSDTFSTDGPANLDPHVGFVLASFVDANKQLHTLSIIHHAVTVPNWKSYELWYNFGLENGYRLDTYSKIHPWQIPEPSYSPDDYYNVGLKMKIKRVKNLITAIFNYPPDGSLFQSWTEFEIDLTDKANPILELFNNKYAGRFGLAVNHNEYLFDSWNFQDHETDFEVPDGWLVADGSILNKEEFGALYASIGDAWNTDDAPIGDDQFQIPDFRGYFLRCYKSELISGRFGEGTKKEDTVVKHGHMVMVDLGGGHNHQYWKWEFDDSLGDPTTPAGINAYGYGAVWAGQREIENLRGLDSASDFIEGAYDTIFEQKRYDSVAKKFADDIITTNSIGLVADTDEPMVPSIAAAKEAGLSRDDMNPKPDLVIKGDNSTLPLDIPQQHIHEVLLGSAQNTDVNIKIEEGRPVNIKIQTFIKY